MSTRPVRRAAIYVKETAGYHPEENTKELQLRHCEEFCKTHGLEITARYHDAPGIRHDFDWMMGEATQDAPPFDCIVVYRLLNFSWSLDENSALPGPAQGQRRHPRVHDGKLGLNDGAAPHGTVHAADRRESATPGAPLGTYTAGHDGTAARPAKQAKRRRIRMRWKGLARRARIQATATDIARMMEWQQGQQSRRIRMKWKGPARKARMRATATDIAGMIAVLSAAAYGAYLTFDLFLSGSPKAMAGNLIRACSLITGLGMTPFIARLEKREKGWHRQEENFAAEQSELAGMYRRSHTCPHCGEAIGISRIA